MYTQAALRSGALDGTVVSRQALAECGVDREAARAHYRARRWQRFGSAVVLQNGPLTAQQRWSVARINCGRRGVFTSFSSAELHGLRGWNRQPAHVLIPTGARVRRIDRCPVVTHQVEDWSTAPISAGRHRLEDSLLIAAGSFESPRPACGLLAAAVQQKLTTAARVGGVLQSYQRLRHRGALRSALFDIEMGSQALSEIDFYRLCRRHNLPLPERQTVRCDRSGRRRYLDATWRRSDGRLVVVEIDGALHLAVRQWWEDQDRQNELSIDGALLLRFPSVVLRTDELRVVGQLRRALRL